MKTLEGIFRVYNASVYYTDGDGYIAVYDRRNRCYLWFRFYPERKAYIITGTVKRLDSDVTKHKVEKEAKP